MSWLNLKIILEFMSMEVLSWIRLSVTFEDCINRYNLKQIVYIYLKYLTNRLFLFRSCQSYGFGLVVKLFSPLVFVYSVVGFQSSDPVTF